MKTVASDRHHRLIPKRGNLDALRERKKQEFREIRRQLRDTSMTSLRYKNGLTKCEFDIYDASFYDPFGHFYDLSNVPSDPNVLLHRINQMLGSDFESSTAYDEVDSIKPDRPILTSQGPTYVRTKTLQLLHDLINHTIDQRFSWRNSLSAHLHELIDSAICAYLPGHQDLDETETCVFTHNSVIVFFAKVISIWANDIEIIKNVIHCLAIFTSIPTKSKFHPTRMENYQDDPQALAELSVQRNIFVSLSRAIEIRVQEPKYDHWSTLTYYFLYTGNVFKTYPDCFNDLISTEFLQILTSFTSDLCRALKLSTELAELSPIEPPIVCLPTYFDGYSGKISLILPENDNLSVARHLVIASSWVLGQLTTVKGEIDYQYVTRIVHHVISMLEKSDHVMAHFILEALEHFSCPESIFVNVILSSKKLYAYCLNAVSKSNHSSSKIAFKILCNLTAYSEDTAMKIAFECKVINLIPKLYADTTISVNDMYSFLKNIIAWKNDAATKIMSIPEVIHFLVDLLNNSFHIDYELCYFFESLVNAASDEQTRWLINEKIVKKYARFFDEFQPNRAIISIINTFKVISQRSEKHGYKAMFLEQIDDELKDKMVKYTIECPNTDLTEKVAVFLDQHVMDQDLIDSPV